MLVQRPNDQAKYISIWQQVSIASCSSSSLVILLLLLILSCIKSYRDPTFHVSLDISNLYSLPCVALPRMFCQTGHLHPHTRNDVRKGALHRLITAFPLCFLLLLLAPMLVLLSCDCVVFPPLLSECQIQLYCTSVNAAVATPSGNQLWISATSDQRLSTIVVICWVILPGTNIDRFRFLKNTNNQY